MSYLTSLCKRKIHYLLSWHSRRSGKCLFTLGPVQIGLNIVIGLEEKGEKDAKASLRSFFDAS